VQGSGHENGLRVVLESATAIMLCAPGLPPLYAAGLGSVKWTTDREFGSGVMVQRFWGLEPAPGARLWIWPDPTMIGIGVSVEDVLQAREALHGATR